MAANLEDNSQNELVVAGSNSPVAVRKKYAPGRKWYSEGRKWDYLPSRKNIGRRSIRRQENQTFLMDLGGEPDLSDYVELTNSESRTSFTELFLEHEKMQLWNEFLGWSEDEQEQFLQWSDGNHSFNEDVVPESENDQQIDKRTVNPAYTAEQSFRRLDQNMRALLRQRHLPMGKLSGVEDEVSGFFQEWPSSVYVCRCSDSFERLLLHCVCQYHNLKSQSFDTMEGRHTEVENLNGDFRLPCKSLSQFLHERRHNIKLDEYYRC